MPTLNQLVSELAHSVQQADSVPVRRALRLSVIHSRNELIRRGYDSNKVTDKILQQRFRIALINVPDGDTVISKDLPVGQIKRSLNKVPRPVRLTNNLPFHSIRTHGVANPMSIPFVKEAASQFYGSLPGMCGTSTYDYINEYVYVDTLNDYRLVSLKHLIVESAFEQPQLIQTETSEGVLNLADVDDDDEFLIPEDMINGIKKLVLEAFNPQVNRQTNEIPTPNLVK